MIQPGSRFPSIRFDNLDGGQYQLPHADAQKMVLLVVYRGFHCGVCKGYLENLASQLPLFANIDVEVIAVSSDTQTRAEQARQEWHLADMGLGYGLSLEAGKQLGLFLSHARKEVEPAQFFEPGLYLIAENAELFFVSIQNMPFGRTATAELLSWIPKTRELGIPPRGTANYPKKLQEKDMALAEGGIAND